MLGRSVACQDVRLPQVEGQIGVDGANTSYLGVVREPLLGSVELWLVDQITSIDHEEISRLELPFESVRKTGVVRP